MFSKDEKVVYPGHGVAKINRIIEKEFGGHKETYYELTFINKGAMIMVPTKNAHTVGIRPLSSKDIVEEALKVLTEPAKRVPNHEFTASNWNKRNKEYLSKLRNGTLKGLSEIYRDLRQISKQKELSFGEKNLLAQAEILLVEEISLVQQLDQDKAMDNIRKLSHTMCL
ncbi:CarD family transcriptional regulator [Candidatus Dependentiae bacterium]|nr:CarD family transcriptional regulator [Candidatus Dependentiae bacterium]